jgi:branched-chain amino acid transport system permease protein
MTLFGASRKVKSAILARPGRLVTWLVVIVVLSVSLSGSAYDLFQYQVVVAYAVAALSLYLTIQVAGEFMVGQVAIIGVAAYTVGWLGQHYAGWSALMTLPFAIVAGALTGLLLGLPGIRLSSLYLGIISFFPVLVIPSITEAFPSITGGENGLAVPPFDLSLVGSPALSLYLVTLLVLAVSIVFVSNIVRSTWGSRLKALRDAPAALPTVGVSVNTTKVWVYLLASVPAALSGWLLAYVNQVVIAGLFDLPLTLILVAAVIIGGRRSVAGVVIAACLLSGYTQLVGPFSEFNQLGLGLLLLVVILALPSGLDSLSGSGLAWRRRRAARELVTRVGTASEHSAEGSHGSARVAARRVARQQRPSGEVVLSVRDIGKAFSGNVAVRSVSFDMAAGRVVGLVGPNGSGKTTVINLISGFHKPDHGTVEVLGQVVSGLQAHRAGRAGISRTFQVPRLVDELSVRRNIEIGILAGKSADDLWRSVFTGGRFGRKEARRRAIVDEVAELLRLPADLLESPAESLSLGTKRIVEVARTLACGARVVCLDEPAAGLNEAEIVQLGLALNDVAESGCAVLLVEHHMRFVLDVCDQIIVLERGEMTSDSVNSGATAVPEALLRHIGVSGRKVERT